MCPTFEGPIRLFQEPLIIRRRAIFKSRRRFQFDFFYKVSPQNFSSSLILPMTFKNYYHFKNSVLL